LGRPLGRRHRRPPRPIRPRQLAQRIPRLAPGARLALALASLKLRWHAPSERLPTRRLGLRGQRGPPQELSAPRLSLVSHASYPRARPSLATRSVERDRFGQLARESPPIRSTKPSGPALFPAQRKLLRPPSQPARHHPLHPL